MEQTEYMIQQEYAEERNLQYNFMAPEKTVTVNKVTDHQPTQEKTVNMQEAQVEEETEANIQDLKMKYEETAVTIRAEVKQIITIQEVEKTTVTILNRKKADIYQQMCDIKKLIDHFATENEIVSNKVMTSNEEILKFKECLKNKEHIVNELQRLSENVKSEYENVSQQRIKTTADFSNLESKFKEHLETSAQVISDLKQKISMNSASSKKDDLNKIKQENLLLQQECDREREILRNMIRADKELDEKLENVKRRTEEKDELEKLVEEKQRSKEERKQELNDILERKNYLIQLKKQQEEKLEEVEKLEVQVKDLDKEISCASEEKVNLQAALESMQETVKNQETDLTELSNNIEELKIDLELLTQKKNEESLELDNQYENLEQEIVSIDADTANLKSKNNSLRSEYAQLVEERNTALVAKCNLEKEDYECEVDKRYVDMYMKRLENKKKQQEQLTNDIQQLKEDNTLQNIVKDKAYLQSSLEYLQEKFKGIKDEEAAVKDDIEKAKTRRSEIKSQREQKEIELNSLKLMENADDQSHLTGILKPKVKTPPVSPKKVTFDMPSQDSSTESSKPSVNTESKQLDALFDSLLSKAIKAPVTPKPTKKRRLHLD